MRLRGSNTFESKPTTSSTILKAISANKVLRSTIPSMAVTKLEAAETTGTTGLKSGTELALIFLIISSSSLFTVPSFLRSSPDIKLIGPISFSAFKANPAWNALTPNISIIAA